MNLQIDQFLGIPWSYPDHDCFALFRSFYKINWDIDIPVIAHPLLWEATHPELDLIRSNVSNAGFDLVDVSLTTMRTGDAIGMCWGNGVRVVNHLGVYLGNGWFLHQPFKALSQMILWSAEWRNSTLMVGRHPLVPREVNRPSVDVVSLLPKTMQRRFNGK